VYSLSNREGNPIVKGVILKKDGSGVWVNYQNGSNSNFLRHHRTGLFTPLEVGATVLDLLPSSKAGEERHISAALDELIKDPESASELGVRLGAKSAERYITTPRIPEDLGIKSKEQLVGSIGDKGSNAWRIESLIEDIQSGKAPNGAANELNLAHATGDMELLPKPEAATIKEHMIEMNRDVLNHFYDQYHVDFSETVVTEKPGEKYLARKTVYPAPEFGFSFVETAFIPNAESGKPGAIPDYLGANIVSGKPEYTIDQGYSPV